MRMNEIKIVEQLDRGLAYAEACFETFRVIKGEVFQRENHELRLQKGLEDYGFICSIADIRACFEKVIAEACIQGCDVLARMTVSVGDADWGLLPKCNKTSTDMRVQVQLMPSLIRHNLHLNTVTWPFPLREKKAKYTSDYAESLRAVVQWKLDNPMQALICSDTEHALSTLTANIALYRQGQWLTPQGLGVLHGIVRQFLLDDGVLVESICPRTWLDDCEALIGMNSGVFVQPVASINGRELPLNHPAINRLVAAFDGMRGVTNIGVMGAGVMGE